MAKKKIGICAGHGGKGSTAGKRTPDNEYEWNFNDKVVRAFIDEINKYEDVEVRRFDDASGNTDVSLTKRTNNANAWGADIYISVHHNANTGKWGTWTGTETFYHAGSASGKKLADAVHKPLVEAMGLRDRGLKTNNLHITRETKMPAVLTEGGYMDSSIDIKKLRDDKVLDKAGRNMAEGVAKYFGLKKKAVSVVKPAESNHQDLEATIHVVQAGDTLWSIAQKHNTTVDNLEKLNKGVQAKALQVGGKVIVSVKAESKPAPKPVAKPKPTPKPVAKPSHSHKYSKLGRAKGNVWSHTKADFSASTRKEVVKTNARLEVCCESNGLYYTNQGWVSTKYVDIVGSLTKVDLPHVVLRRGDRGSNVVQVQRALNKLKFKCGAEDGIYGAGTQDAVKRFQMVHDPRNVDGIYGSRTESRMENLLNK